MDAYVEVIVKAGEMLGLEAEVLMDGWVINFKKGNKSFDVMTFDVGLNKSVHQKKVMDKVMCYTILKKNGVAAVEHYFYKNPQGSQYKWMTLRELSELARKYNYNVVLKPNKGAAGKNVYLVHNEHEFDVCLIDLLNKHVDIALSPYYEYDTEYRLVVLDGEVLMGFGKRKSDKDFRHNLSAGSSVVEIPEEIREELYDLAVRAAKAIGIRFVTVDIINHVDGFKVLEINNSVTLKRIASVNTYWKNKCIEAYRRALEKVVEEMNM